MLGGAMWEEMHRMPSQPDRPLELTYSPNRGFWHFVLYVQPPASAGGALNAMQIVREEKGHYAAQWLERRQPCVPDAPHVSLVSSEDGPKLCQPCVYDDPDSPAAIAGEGCRC